MPIFMRKICFLKRGKKGVYHPPVPASPQQVSPYPPKATACCSTGEFACRRSQFRHVRQPSECFISNTQGRIEITVKRQATALTDKNPISKRQIFIYPTTSKAKQTLSIISLRSLYTVLCMTFSHYRAKYIFNTPAVSKWKQLPST